MKCDLFINFDGNCREALNFYAKVFQLEVNDLMTYGQTSPDASDAIPEADKDKIMYADIKFDNLIVMFMDMPTGVPLVSGNHIMPTVSFESKAELERVFHALKEKGTVNAQLEKTFFSELYGMVTDQFGIGWQLLYNAA